LHPDPFQEVAGITHLVSLRFLGRMRAVESRYLAILFEPHP
jgi:hypothetical protein